MAVKELAKMNQEVIEMLKVLADKFGTTTEHLWSVLLNQAFLSGLFSTAFLSVILISSVWWVRFALARIKKEKEENGYYSYPEDSAILWISIILLIPACGIVSTIIVYDIMTAFLNPEYWALNRLLSK